MALKILFTDFDYTLSDERRKISERDFAALKRLNENGVRVILCTGRMTSSVKKLLPLFPFPIAFSAFNGGENVDERGNVIERRVLSVESGATFSKFAEENRLLCHAYTDEVLTEKQNAWTDKYIKILGVNGRWTDKPLSEYILENELETPKIQICNPDGDIKGYAEILKEKYGDFYEFLIVGGNCVDVSPKGITKGYALEKFCDKFKVKPSETVAIGDDDNDISMIKLAGVGVSPANAKDEVKKISDFVTESKNGGAIAEITEKIFKM